MSIKGRGWAGRACLRELPAEGVALAHTPRLEVPKLRALRGQNRRGCGARAGVAKSAEGAEVPGLRQVFLEGVAGEFVVMTASAPEA